MKRIALLFLIYFLTSSVTAFAEDCSDQKWVRDKGRTQAGGWIWFPGKGTGESEQLAYLKAEGMAVDRLIKECSFPHIEVKFHERCDEKVGNFYRAYVRASLTNRQCNETKYAAPALKTKITNKKLLKVHEKYLKAITKNTAFEEKACRAGKSFKCHEMGKYEFQMGNSEKAFQYFNTACKDGNMDSCFNAGITQRALGRHSSALPFFKLTCQGKKAEDGEGCYFVGLILLKKNELTKAKTYLNRGCDNDVTAACFKLGQIYKDENNSFLSRKYLAKSCQSDFKEGCFETSKIYYDQGDKIKAKEFSRKGCRMDHKKSCYNLGSLEKKNKNKSLKAFVKSCDLGLGLGCLKAAKLKKSQSLYSRACELGMGKACRQLSNMFYDKGQKDESLRYSMVACKLGELKSCHNAGMLLYKMGDKPEAKDFLKQSCNQGLRPSCKLIKKYSL